jgi:hypothetical protein
LKELSHLFLILQELNILKEIENYEIDNKKIIADNGHLNYTEIIKILELLSSREIIMSKLIQSI